MLPELAALVSQKFTFSVSISQKNLTQRNVSFQVNNVVTFFGKQTHIPKPIENVYDRATESSAVTSTPSSNYENADTSTPPRRPRLDRKAIPCRRNLISGSSDTGLKDTHFATKNDGSKDAEAQEDLSIQNEESSASTGAATAAGDSVATTTQNSDDVNMIETPQSSGKHRSGRGRKKAAA